MPSEFRDEVLACADCGGPLTDGAAEEQVAPAARAPAALHPAPCKALGVTLALLVSPVLLEQVPLAGVDDERIPRFFTGFLAHPPDLSPFALGLWPIFMAFVIVELGALLVPAWRSLRHGGVAGRARLQTATALLTLGIALVQGWFLAEYLGSLDLFVHDSAMSRATVALSVTAGACCYLALAMVADRHALLSGFSLLIGAKLVGDCARGAGVICQAILSAQPLVNLPLTVLAGIAMLAVVGWTFTRRRARGELPLPACGIVPFHAVAFVSWFALKLSGLTMKGPFYLSSTQYLAVVVASALILVWLFNPRAQLARFAGAGIDVIRPLIRGTWRSVALVGGFAALYQALHTMAPPASAGDSALDFLPSVTALFTAVALALDLRSHWRARRTLGVLVPIWPEHRVYAVDAALEALERAGITGHARGMHHRTLWHFFGPALPIVFFVPREDVTRAERVLAQVLGGDGLPPGPPYRS